ncbi:hypothetical protein V6N11_006274 [Hibiscus sabdariffa]|uniref:Uncharacterized protein n=1 Tax=Hibiscus sabdariffa TaxID=183260 RepID=A0ABR2RQ83_9ROSI
MVVLAFPFLGFFHTSETSLVISSCDTLLLEFIHIYRDIYIILVPEESVLVLKFRVCSQGAGELSGFPERWRRTSLDFTTLNFACFSYQQFIPLSASAGDALRFKEENFEKFDAI